MKAIVLAAGFGLRLKPLTNYLPKVLLPILGVPALDHVLARLSRYGLEEVGINMHYMPDQIISHVRSSSLKNMKIYLAKEETILGTGGALYNFRDFLAQERLFCVHNGDIISDINIPLALEFHQRRKNLATLLLWDYPAINTVVVDREGNVLDFLTSSFSSQAKESYSPDQGMALFTFTGISIIDVKLLDYLSDGYSDIITLYKDIIRREGPGRIGGLLGKGQYWADFGTPSHYLDLHRDLIIDQQMKHLSPQVNINSHDFSIESPPSMRMPRPCIFTVKGNENDISQLSSPFQLKGKGKVYSQREDVLLRGAEVTISERAHLQGFVCLGQRCIIEEDVWLKDCVVWADTIIKPGTRLCRAIISKDFICRKTKNDSNSGISEKDRA